MMNDFREPRRMAITLHDQQPARGRTGFSALGLCAALAIVSALVRPALADQMTFETPDAAVAALKAAVEKHDQEAMRRLFGPDIEDLKSGDEVQDKGDLTRFAKRLRIRSRLEEESADVRILHIGTEDFPFPIPIVRKDGRWFFDTDAGKDEMLSRRIGENELNAISVCRGYVLAQREYFQEDRDGDDVLEYAQRLASTPGRKDGLYWEAGEGEPLSPLGPLVAEARSEGYGENPSTQPDRTNPYHGYVYRILTRQGAKAPGGRFDYVVNGHMVAGFALLAYPVEYGDSGIMTFLVGPNGKVYQKDLGEKTSSVVAGMNSFDPDETWQVTED